jgi:antitoxin VapB
MATQLNIKSEEARALAQDLARLTGKSMTEVIVESLRDRLAEVRRSERATIAQDEAREAGFGRLIHGSRGLWQPAMLSGDPTDLLYDTDGLPR